MEIISLWQIVHMQLNATQDTYQSTWVDCIHSRHQNVSLIEFPHQNRSGSDKYSRVFSCIDANRLQKQQQISLQYLSFFEKFMLPTSAASCTNWDEKDLPEYKVMRAVLKFPAFVPNPAKHPTWNLLKERWRTISRVHVPYHDHVLVPFPLVCLQHITAATFLNGNPRNTSKADNSLN